MNLWPFFSVTILGNFFKVSFAKKWLLALFERILSTKMTSPNNVRAQRTWPAHQFQQVCAMRYVRID